MPDFTFKRAERLKSRKVIEQLFKQGQSFAQYPLRIVWVEMAEPRSEFPAQFALSVSKKKFKRAVDRNRIRRLVREAYRLNKHVLYRGWEDGRMGDEQQGTGSKGQETSDKRRGVSGERRTANSQQPIANHQLGLMIIYTASEILTFTEIEEAMQKMLRRLLKKLRADNQT